MFVFKQLITFCKARCSITGLKVFIVQAKGRMMDFGCFRTRSLLRRTRRTWMTSRRSSSSSSSRPTRFTSHKKSRNLEIIYKKKFLSSFLLRLFVKKNSPAFEVFFKSTATNSRLRAFGLKTFVRKDF
jgi:hypothetical protein